MANESKVVMDMVENLAEDVLRTLHKAGQKDMEIIGYAASEILPLPTADPILRVC